MIQSARTLLFVVAMTGLAACSDGSDNGTSSQPGAPPGSNTPPGNTTPQPTAQVGRFNAPVAGIIPVPNGNGDVYVAGSFTTYNNQPVRPVVRLRPNGTLNDSFKLTDAITAPAHGIITAIAVADDGSGDLYVSEYARVWKVSSAGAIASGFTTGELTYTNHPSDSPGTTVAAMAPVGDGSGRVYLGGVFDTYNQTPVRHLARLNPNGTIDQAFVPQPGFWIWNLLPSRDGSGDLYVISLGIEGPASNLGTGGMGRLNPDGTVDTAFHGLGAIDDSPYAMSLAEDGSGDVFAAGNVTLLPPTLPGFARVNPDGSIDETSPRLNPDGTPNPTSWSGLWFPKFLTAATDGTNDWFVVKDVFSPDGSSSVSQLRRFKQDGTPDPSFTAGQAPRFNVFVHCVVWFDCRGINLILPAPDNTGDVYVAGSFTTYNSVPVGHIVRLNRDGTLE